MLSQQSLVRAYVEKRLAAQGITKAEACMQYGLPEKLVDRFLEDVDFLNYAELLRVIIMFGSALGDPVELASACGVDVSDED